MIVHKVLVILASALLVLGNFPQDPYSVLGISRSASLPEIKRVYKKLAMEWHPDKNDSPDASEKFMKIQQSYEILTDPERKERYDRFGSLDEPRQHGNYHQGNPFDDFFYGFGGGNRGKPTAFENHRMTLRMYTHSVLERSYIQPFLIFGYSTYCPACFAMESFWTEAVKDLEQLGYGIGTVNYMFDGNLFEKLRISRVPSLLVLVEGRVIHFRGNYHELNARAIRVFARDAIPNTFMHRINTYNGLKRFLDQWETTNKPSILFMGSNPEPRVRYLLTAMKNSHFARFAYIHLSEPSADIKEMRNVLGIRCTNCESVLIFKENPKDGPSDRLLASGHQFTSEQLNNLLERHKFLSLPRLSSMQFFDELCPVSARSQRHYCLILPVSESDSDTGYISAMRRFVTQNKDYLNQNRVHVSYIFVNRQKEFMSQFGKHLRWEENKKRDILVLWRNEYVKARITWIPSMWSADKDVEYKTFENLKDNLQRMVRGDFRFEETAVIPNLNDEYEPSFFTRIAKQVVRMAMTLWFHLTKEEVLPVLSVVGTMAVIFLIGYFLNFFLGDQKTASFEPEKPPPYSEQQQQRDWHPEDPKTAANGGQNGKRSSNANSVMQKRRVWKEMEPMIHELRAETYFGLIRLLKPGCRSIVVLVDEDSKDVLLPQFARYVYLLRKNKTFSFGYLMVNKNLHWFRTLLEHILPMDSENPHSTSSKFALTMFSRLKSINPKQTLGTVLVLCGYKLYFSMYHPLHEGVRNRDSSDDCTEDESMDDVAKGIKKGKGINLENVLHGLPNFLDRLLEGSIRRYYVPEWPETLK